MKISQLKIGLLTGSIATTLFAGPLFAAAPAQPAAKSPATAPETKPDDKTSVQRWDDRILDEFQRMEGNMERIFSDATHDLNQSSPWLDHGTFNSSIRTSEDKDNYIVHVYLPDRQMQNLKAKVEGDRLLRITASEQQGEKTTGAAKPGEKSSPATSNFEMGRFEELLTLPGPVDASKVKVDRSGTSVTITVPKSQSQAATPPQH